MSDAMSPASDRPDDAARLKEADWLTNAEAAARTLTRDAWPHITHAGLLRLVERVRDLLATVDALTATVRDKDAALVLQGQDCTAQAMNCLRAENRVRELEVIIEKFVVDKARLEATVAEKTARCQALDDAGGQLARCLGEVSEKVAALEATVRERDADKRRLTLQRDAFEKRAVELAVEVATLEMDKVRLVEHWTAASALCRDWGHYTAADAYAGCIRNLEGPARLARTTEPTA